MQKALSKFQYVLFLTKIHSKYFVVVFLKRLYFLYNLFFLEDFQKVLQIQILFLKQRTKGLNFKISKEKPIICYVDAQIRYQSKSITYFLHQQFDQGVRLQVI
ncbi:unnamed protein product [Paramecium octaurelia]|uniref:Transmembrane protein n=1 Tax=Paramecium octaurelia TaxID=43137 RepID=A0A8S1WZT5_PAROT|nr:unnamed protein product [Paramecium octaurelia]